jgi:hypothetical protein
VLIARKVVKGNRKRVVKENLLYCTLLDKMKVRKLIAHLNCTAMGGVQQKLWDAVQLQLDVAAGYTHTRSNTSHKKMNASP